jgi:FlaG/FlaF family flagellin (archaellin)
MPDHRHDTAVSEMVGSILMVAVTVIFAMLVGATVLSLAGSMQQTKIVGVVAVRLNASFVSVTYYGCDKPDQVRQLNISVNGIHAATLGDGTPPLHVGNSTVVGASLPGKDHVVVVGAFADGTAQVVLDTRV